MAAPELKRCTACQQLKPSTEFYKHKEGKGGLHPECKPCLLERGRKWRKANRAKCNAASYKWAKAHPEYLYNRGKRQREKYPERHAARNLTWYYANRENVSARQKTYRHKLGDELKVRRAGEHYKNAERNRARANAWRIANPDRRRLNHLRREARKRSLPHSWTIAEMNAARAYWGDICPVCGASTKEVRHWDHWIPLIDPACPGTVASNAVPLCATCNLHKNDSPPDRWLRRQFPQTWETIRSRVETYLKSQETQQCLSTT